MSIPLVDSLVFIADADGLYALPKAPPVTGEPERVVISFAVVPTRDYFVEFRDSLDAVATWQTLCGVPHNLGSAVDPSTNSQRFYRVRSVERTPQ